MAGTAGSLSVHPPTSLVQMQDLSRGYNTWMASDTPGFEHIHGGEGSVQKIHFAFDQSPCEGCLGLLTGRCSPEIAAKSGHICPPPI
jgi:hypothetical protein